jgi:hypothetical protein
MQAQTETTRSPIFLFDAAGAVTRWFWPARERRWFLLGGCLFWFLVLTVLWAWYLVKGTAWAVVIMALVVAQGILLAGGACEAAWRPAARKIARRWEARR